MTHKYFHYDKNYLLKQAQSEAQDHLLQTLIDLVKENYLALHNPLGLIDDAVEKVLDFRENDTLLFDEFYNDLAAIYRYKYGEVQLEFLWDGTSHFKKYSRDWETQFIKWTNEFCAYEPFIKAVFELTVFKTQMTRPELAQSRLKNFLFNHFNLKIYCYKGIVQKDQEFA
ncbi:MAG: hypothetical protein O2887_10960 [Bacteroidetes bacterium]|nr:hypothetical protein [Bacteroidota bacterium]MDA1120990.1 hypothetical protein [Bacteroidota bacterium]